MATATIDTCIGDKATEVFRKATHLAGEARQLTSLAGNAVEDGVQTASRAIRRAVANTADFRDSAVYRVRRHPLKAVGLAFGAGLLLGAVVSAFGRRRRV